MTSEMYSYLLTGGFAGGLAWFFTSRYYGWRMNKDQRRSIDALNSKDADHGRELRMRDDREQFLTRENRRLRDELRQALTSGPSNERR